MPLWEPQMLYWFIQRQAYHPINNESEAVTCTDSMESKNVLVSAGEVIHSATLSWSNFTSTQDLAGKAKSL